MSFHESAIEQNHHRAASADARSTSTSCPTNERARRHASFAAAIALTIGALLATAGCSNASEAQQDPIEQEPPAKNATDPAEPKTDAPDPPQPDAAARQPDAGGPKEAGPAPLSCGTHPRKGALLPFVQQTGTATAATGGTLADGTYHLVELRYWGPPSSRPSSKFGASFYLANGRYEWETTDQVGDLSSAGPIAFSGVTMKWTKDCGESFGPFDYRATPSGFTFLQKPAPGIVLEFVLSRE